MSNLKGIFGEPQNHRRFFRDGTGQVWDIEDMETGHIVEVTKLLMQTKASRPDEKNLLELPAAELKEAIKSNDLLEWPLTMQILAFRRVLSDRNCQQEIEELNEFRKGLS